MKLKHKSIVTLSLLLIFSTVYSQKKDTLSITAKNLQINKLKERKHHYMVYFKDSKDSPSKNISLVKIDIKSSKHNNINAFAVHQEWNQDSITHTSHTLFSKKDFSTLFHKYYWSRNKLSVSFDFLSKKISYNGNADDAFKSKAKKNFLNSFKEYNLNWHSDLIIFPLLPFKENRVFKINFYDPPGAMETVYYSVVGSEHLTTYSGKSVNCWILKFDIPKKYGGGVMKFWISKKDRDLIKEEDMFGKKYRYKIKLTTTE